VFFISDILLEAQRHGNCTIGLKQFTGRKYLNRIPPSSGQHTQYEHWTSGHQDRPSRILRRFRDAAAGVPFAKVTFDKYKWMTRTVAWSPSLIESYHSQGLDGSQPHSRCFQDCLSCRRPPPCWCQFHTAGVPGRLPQRSCYSCMVVSGLHPECMAYLIGCSG
jgi:hypothetical protein